jgi:ankyrin repeat protein
VKNIQLLLKKGAEVDAEGGTYGSALMAAAHKGRRTIVELLFNQDADINASGGLFGNAIQAAIANDKVDVVELLLSRGVKANITEELLMNVRETWSKRFVDRLRHFDPKMWIQRWIRNYRKQLNNKLRYQKSSPI